MNETLNQLAEQLRALPEPYDTSQRITRISLNAEAIRLKILVDDKSDLESKRKTLENISEKVDTAAKKFGNDWDTVKIMRKMLAIFREENLS